MPRQYFALILFALSAACTTTTSGTADPSSPMLTERERAAQARYEQLLTLEGEWVTRGEDGRATDELASVWRSTAGGTAMVETLFPGTEHEMVTVFHRDGGDLLLTHYCSAGNQPRMRAMEASTPRELAFRFIDGSNMHPLDPHMHEAHFELVDEDRYVARWVLYVEGVEDHAAEFDLVRRR